MYMWMWIGVRGYVYVELYTCMCGCVYVDVCTRNCVCVCVYVELCRWMCHDALPHRTLYVVNCMSYSVVPCTTYTSYSVRACEYTVRKCV